MALPHKLVRWDITNRCNRNCRHCITADKYTDEIECSTQERKKLVDKMEKFGIGRIHLLGGEPLVIKNISELIDYVITKNIFLSLNTNGFRLCDDENLAKQCSERKVGVSFSLDGVNALTHDKIRGMNSYSEVIAAMNNVAKYSSSDNINAIYMTLSQDNIHSNFEEIFRLAKEFNIYNIVFGFVIPSGNAAIHYAENPVTLSLLLDTVVEISRIALDYSNITVSFPFQTPLLSEYLRAKLHIDFPIRYSKCKCGLCEFQLTPGGFLYPCIFLISPEKTIKYNNLDVKITKKDFSLLDNDFCSIVNNNYYKEVFLKILHTANLDKIEPCRYCIYHTKLGICGPCAFQNYDENENVFHRHLLCEEIKQHGNFGNRE